MILKGIYITVCTIMLLFSYFLMKSKPSKARMFLALTLLSAGFWNFSLLVSVSTTDEFIKILFHELKYVGVTTLSIHMLLFTLYFSNVGASLTRRHIAGLYSFSAVMMILIATNGYHHLFRTALWVEMQGGVGIVLAENGPLFYLAAGVMYTMSLISALICINRIMTVSQIHRMQYVMLLSGIVCPFIINAFYNVFKLNGKSIDPTPISTVVMALLIYYAYRLDWSFDIGPMARDQVFQQIRQPVFVTNAEYIVNDLNATAEKVFSLSLMDVFGRHVETVCPEILVSDKLEYEGRIYDIQRSDMFVGHKAHIGYAFLLQDVTEKELYMRELQSLSYHDNLTQVYNKHYLKDWESKIGPSILPIGLIYSDMNLLKKVNDTYGHDAGDELIIGVIKQMEALIETDQFIVRLGGDEFLVVVPSVVQESALQALAMKIRGIEMPYESIVATVSVGTAMMTSMDVSFYELVKQADENMYQDKNKNRKYEI
ncbi:MAG: diguanylate cyclase [Clostridia bacterium]|nr:diguanylate cyclase [Clostridia bacterium]